MRANLANPAFDVLTGCKIPRQLLSWDQWLEKYPARVVEAEPHQVKESITDNQMEAEQIKDFMELYNGVAYEVVKYKESFYVIAKND